MAIPSVSELNPQAPSYVAGLDQGVDALKGLIFHELRKLKGIDNGLYSVILSSEALYRRIVQELRTRGEITAGPLEESVARPTDQKEIDSVDSIANRLSQLTTSYQDFCLAIYRLTEIIPVTESNPDYHLFQFLVVHGDDVYVMTVDVNNNEHSSFKPHPHLQRQHLEAESSLQTLKQMAQNAGHKGNLYIVKNPSSRIRKPEMLADYAALQTVGETLLKRETPGGRKSIAEFAFGLGGDLFVRHNLYL